MKKAILLFIFQLCSLAMFAQINTDRVLTIGRNALYFEDYVLSIQYFNQVIKSKPWLAEPYFYRAVAKINLDDYKGAEEDCTLCLERNPFLVQAYYARGIARQSQEKFDEAIEDYRKGLEFKAEDRQMLVNMAVANIQKKDAVVLDETQLEPRGDDHNRLVERHVGLDPDFERLIRHEEHEEQYRDFLEIHRSYNFRQK